jgi:predicted DNA-binding protein YlxM (UPF0122 family)
MPRRKIIDWEGIEQDYRAGQFSLHEIAKKHEITHQAISIRAKRKGWKRDLSRQVKKRLAEKLVTDVVGRPATEEEITEAAAQRAVELIKLHRKDIANLQEQEQKILAELGDNPTKLWVGQYQGQVIEHVVGIAVTERASALQALASVQHKRIALERQAYGIDDDGRRPDHIEELNITFIEAHIEGQC